MEVAGVLIELVSTSFFPVFPPQELSRPWYRRYYRRPPLAHRFGYNCSLHNGYATGLVSLQTVNIVFVDVWS